jgi:hypothetical protein
MLTAVAPPTPNVQESYLLEQNFPNPFNPSTTIPYSLPQRAHVTLLLFNTLGQQVMVLQKGEQNAGYHEVKLDASGLSSGVYFYSVQIRPQDSRGGHDSETGAPGFFLTRALLLLR